MKPVAAIALAALTGACGRETPPPVAPPAAPVAPPVAVEAPPKPTPTPTPEPVAATADAIEPHVAELAAACLARTGADAAKPALAIHRWVDASGITHYSDTAPAAPVGSHRVIETPRPEIEVTASGYDASLPTDVRQRAVADALAVQRVFRDTLGIAGPRSASLKIVFVRSADAYARLVGAGVLAASTGAYVPLRRTIYVRLQADEAVGFEVLRHEIAHALIHEWVGQLPVSLNEGLAEYFRRLRTSGMGGQVDLATERATLVAAAPAGDGTDALIDLLARVGPDFYAGERERRYPQAYALIAVLMQGGPRTAALREVLVRQQAEPCVPVAAETILDRTYPGGLAALASDWAGFLRDPPAGVRAY